MSPATSEIGTSRTWRDVRLESAFGGRAEVGFRRQQAANEVATAPALPGPSSGEQGPSEAAPNPPARPRLAVPRRGLDWQAEIEGLSHTAWMVIFALIGVLFNPVLKRSTWFYLDLAPQEFSVAFIFCRTVRRQHG